MSSPAPAQRLGPYELIASIGKGGMGEVWRARDTRLNRDVAIKFSQAEFSDRFQREAQAIASLNHPNICTLFDVGPNYLVMELIEGPTLADRIKEGPLPLDEALAIARPIADALEAAHLKGIVHRDLKPGNVKIAPDGTVKVLDFGLAKMPEASEVSSDSPTLMHSPTMVGVILGTAAYMAPEQARGKTVDKRADIWAFGVVLYEMVTGKRLFEGEDLTETLASVVKSEANLAPVPEKIRPLLEKCLEKDPKKRLRDIGDWTLLLASEHAVAAPSQSRFGSGLWIAIAAVFALVAIALAILHFREQPPAERVVRLSVPVPEKTNVGFLALSPDGRRLALVLYSEKDNGLYVRSLDSGELQLLPDTRGARTPFWSPDSRFIAYFDSEQNKLKVIAAGGGPARTLCGDLGRAAGSWSAGGVILFSDAKGLRRVDSNGGDCTRVGKENTRDSTAETPTFLPDGKHFFYLRTSPASDQSGIYLATLDSPEGHRILADQSGAVYAPPASAGAHSHLLFLRANAVMAQPIDPATFQTAGDPFLVARPASVSYDLSQPAIGASADGTLVYLTGSALSTESQFYWFDRSGKDLGTTGPRTFQLGVTISPDGTSALTFQQHQEIFEIWLYDLIRNGSPSHLTGRENGQASVPVWSPDSTRVWLYMKGHQGFGLYRKDVRSGQEELILKAANPDQIWNPSDLSRDGRYLIYTDRSDPKKQGDIWYLPLESGKPAGPPVMLVGTIAQESQGQISPDGKWLAYFSNESGTGEVYVRPFPSGSGVWKATVEGGAEPRWRADGKELFFRRRLVSVMSVTVTPDGHGGLAFGSPQKVFDFRQVNSVLAPLNIWSYSPHPDGKRFLVNQSVETEKPTVNVILHWQKAVGGAK